MVIQPQYRPDLKTEVAQGIIDTDEFYGSFNILFTIKDTDSNRVRKIKSGTPLAQIIPFVRGEWNMVVDKMDKDRQDRDTVFAHEIDAFYDRYQWTRKVFKDERN